MRGLLAAALWLGASTAVAGVVDTPECRHGLAMADQRIRAVRLREDSVQPGDYAGLCRVLRQNLQNMAAARDPMARCMTGHETVLLGELSR